MEEQYQRGVKRTMPELDRKDALQNYALGLCGEGGEVADLIKKHVWHGHELDRSALMKEIGDVLWYTFALMETLDLKAENVMRLNIQKLLARYPDGFSTEASRNRNL